MSLFWILILLWSLVPLWHQRRMTANRFRQLSRIEEERGTRLITLIHRQESLSILGLPLARYITIEDSEQVLRAIRLTPDEMPIDLLLHTPGGLVLAAEQIAHAIRGHPAKVTVFVPHYAMSGGTLIALAADEIVMDENAVLGPVDPQLGNYPAASILRAVEQKGRERADDRTLILADVAEKALDQVFDTVHSILRGKMEAREAERVAKVLTMGKWTHDYPITCEQLAELGIRVTSGLPPAFYDLMELYPQPPGRRPSVQYVPLPYERDRSPSRR